MRRPLAAALFVLVGFGLLAPASADDSRTVAKADRPARKAAALTFARALRTRSDRLLRRAVAPNMRYVLHTQRQSKSCQALPSKGVIRNAGERKRFARCAEITREHKVLEVRFPPHSEFLEQFKPFKPEDSSWFNDVVAGKDVVVMSYSGNETAYEVFFLIDSKNRVAGVYHQIYE